jgi:ribosomal-protein-alanine acetyltransferase
MRRARFDDIDALTRLEAESFASDMLSRRSFLRFMRSPSAVLLVACRRNRMLGYAVLLLRRGTRSARLYSIAVAADEAGHGVGSRLLDAAEAAARERKAIVVRLEVRADNPSAIRFYERRGYRQIGTRPDYYEDGTTALLFSHLLHSAGPIATSSRRLRHAA